MLPISPGGAVALSTAASGTSLTFCARGPLRLSDEKTIAAPKIDLLCVKATCGFTMLFAN